MADFSKVAIDSVSYNVKDATARLQIAVNAANIATNKTDIAIQKSRIDEITALPSGSTSGDAELQDIRVAANGTTYSSAGNAVRGQITDLKNQLDNGNVSQIRNAGPKQTTYQGITYTANSDGSVTMSGTATATSIYNLYQQEDSFPDGIVPGGTYSFSFGATNQNVTFRIYFYIGSDLRAVEWFQSDGVVHVPTNATGMLIRIGVLSGTTVNETVHPMFWTGLTNADLSDKVDTVEKSVKNKAAIAWSRGIMNADGTTSYYNGATSGFIKYPNDIYIEPGMQIIVFLYRGEGYLGKINASGLIDKEASGNWKRFEDHVNISDYLKLVNADSIRMSLIPTNGVTITSDNVAEVANANVIVYTDKYVNSVEQKKKEPIIETGIKNPLYPFYDQFVFKTISNDGSNIIYGLNSNVRCSVIAKFESSVYLTMLNPDYSFGIYWYDADKVYHSKLWDTTWEVPGGVPVGIAIRRHEASSNSERIETETPWIYLVPCSTTQEPKDYFKAEIEDTIQKVKAAYTEPGLCFLLSTDQHYMTVQNWLMKYDNITDMVSNMKAVCKGITVDGHIALGDIADFKIPISTEKAEQFGIKDMSYANLDSIFYHWMDYAMAQLRSVHPNFIYVPGNHDDNRYLNRDGAKASVSEWDYTKGEVFSYYMAHNFPEKMFNTENNGLDYYLDYQQFKIRIIAIDSNYYNPESKSWNYGYSDATVSWLTNVLSGTPSGYSVLLLSHMSPVYTHNADNYLYPDMDLIQAAIEAYISGGGDFIGTLYGHSHVDWSTTTPWLEISFCSQKLHNGSVTPEIENMPSAVSPDRNIGTASEDCWNVVLILPGSRKIKVIRFGAGEDMEFAY